MLNEKRETENQMQNQEGQIIRISQGQSHNLYLLSVNYRWTQMQQMIKIAIN